MRSITRSRRGSPTDGAIERSGSMGNNIELRDFLDHVNSVPAPA
ncbi:hypothetical protein AB0E12_15285 [Micromonospora chersina]